MVVVSVVMVESLMFVQIDWKGFEKFNNSKKSFKTFLNELKKIIGRKSLNRKVN